MILKFLYKTKTTFWFWFFMEQDFLALVVNISGFFNQTILIVFWVFSMFKLKTQLQKCERGSVLPNTTLNLFSLSLKFRSKCLQHKQWTNLAHPWLLSCGDSSINMLQTVSWIAQFFVKITKWMPMFSSKSHLF